MTTSPVMTVTDELLAELETLAEWATEAPWEWDGRKVDSDGSVYIPECSYLVGAICLASDYEGYQHDCDYIAAAKPDTMKALTSELRRLRAENAELLRVVRDVRWRVADTTDQLQAYGFNGDRLYGLDEWSGPIRNLNIAISMLEKATQ